MIVIFVLMLILLTVNACFAKVELIPAMTSNTKTQLYCVSGLQCKIVTMFPFKEFHLGLPDSRRSETELSKLPTW